MRTSAAVTDRYGEALAALALGMCLLHGGDRPSGERSLRLAVFLGESAGEVHVRSYALGLLALAAAESRDWPAAEAAARDGLEMRAALGDEFGVSFALEVLACVAVSGHHDAERAAVLLGAAESWRRAVGLAWQTVVGLDEVRALGRDAARSALGARTFDAAVRRGHEMDREQSIRFARDGEVAEAADGGALAPGARRRSPSWSGRGCRTARSRTRS
jgi:non-specific serine/threonine protein kinase